MAPFHPPLRQVNEMTDTLEKIPETYQDDSVTAFFKAEAVPDERASKAAGRPIHRDEIHCEVRIPGDRYYQPVAPAHAMWIRIGGVEVTYAMRFARQYNRFIEDLEQIAEGTPLSELTFLTEAKRQDLRGLKIYTAESLAALEGSHLKSLGAMGHDLKAKAKAYLETASGAGRAAEMAARIRELEAQVSLIKGGAGDEADETETLKARFAELTGSRPKGNPSIDSLRRMVAEAEQG